MDGKHKFTINVNHIDENGDVELSPLTIIANPPKNDIHSGWMSTFSIKVPDYLWNGLKGREMPGRDRYQSGKDTRVYGSTPREFPKTITRQTVREIADAWSQLMGDYRYALKLAKANYQKVIFYELGTKCTPFTVAWQSQAELGGTSQASFNYAIGYLLQMADETDCWGAVHAGQYRYDVNKRIVGRYQNEKFYAMKYVTWTEQRQNFFDRLQLAFDRLREQIDAFEQQMSEDTIDLLAAGNARLLHD